MRLSALVPLLASLLVPLGPAGAQTVANGKAITSAPAATPETMSGADLGFPGVRCAPASTLLAGKEQTIEIRCHFDYVDPRTKEKVLFDSATSTTITIIDDDHIRLSMETKRTPPKPGASQGPFVQDWAWIRPCPAGVTPGDNLEEQDLHKLERKDAKDR